MSDEAMNEQYKAKTSEDSAPKEQAIDPDLLELSMEYADDAEYIRGMISDALKKQDYETARDQINRYAPVAQDDAKFQALADLAANQFESQDELSILETQLKATPDGDLDRRIKLLKRILDITPVDDLYKSRLNKYLALKIERDKINDKIVSTDSSDISEIGENIEDNRKFRLIGTDTDRPKPVITYYSILSIPWFVLLFVGFLETGVQTGSILRLLMAFLSLVAVIIHLNVSINPARNLPSGARIGIAWAIWLLGGCTMWGGLDDGKSDLPDNSQTIEAPANPGN